MLKMTSPGQLDHLTQIAIKNAETFCDRENEIHDELMEMLPPELKEAGKKAICNGMAVGKAFTTEALLALCRSAQ